jgi:lipopolysaccharide/colanic/teichoic acid biosynthesis glycosyltransferase
VAASRPRERLLHANRRSGGEGSARRGRASRGRLEVALAAGGLIAAAPVLVVAAAAVAATTGRPVFFRQVRVGRHGRPFTLIKLRTMRAAAGSPDRR